MLQIIQQAEEKQNIYYCLVRLEWSATCCHKQWIRDICENNKLIVRPYTFSESVIRRQTDAYAMSINQQHSKLYECACASRGSSHSKAITSQIEWKTDYSYVYI